MIHAIVNKSILYVTQICRIRNSKNLICAVCKQVRHLMKGFCSIIITYSYIRVTLISKILEFQKAGSTTSRYTSMDHKTGFRFSLSQK